MILDFRNIVYWVTKRGCRRFITAAILTLLSIGAANADGLAEDIEKAMIKYLAETRNFTLSSVAATVPLGSAFNVPSVAHADGLEGLLNTGQAVELWLAIEGQKPKTSFSLDQRYQLKNNYAWFITRELKTDLTQRGINSSEFAKTLANSGIVFGVYREKLEQPLDTMGIGIMRKPTFYVVASVQTLRLGRLQYDGGKASVFDELVGEKNVFAELNKRLSKHSFMLDGKATPVGDVGATKLALGRIM